MVKNTPDQQQLHTLLLALLNQHSESLFIRDSQHQYLWANAAHLKLLGHKKPDEIYGKTVGELLGNEFGQYAQAESQSVLDTGQARHNREEPFHNHATLVSSLYPLLDPKTAQVAYVGGHSRVKAPLGAQDEQLAVILSESRCLLWEAMVLEWPLPPDEDGTAPRFNDNAKTCLFWDIHVVLPGAVRRWLPISWHEGQPFENALHRARHPEDQVQIDKTCIQALKEGAPSYQNQYRIQCADGTWIWLQENVTITPLEPGRWRLVGTCTDITSLKATEEALKRVLETAHCLIWNATIERRPIPYDNPDECQAARDQGMWETGTYFFWDIQIFAEDAARSWLPVENDPEQFYDQAIYEAIAQEDRTAGDRHSSKALLEGWSGYTQELKIRMADGKYRCVQEDVHLEKVGPDRWYAVGINIDVTERKQIEQTLAHQAQHDALTGLANRRHLQDALSALTPRPQNKPALLFLDLDNFKRINDNFGHLVGDQVLVTVARRLEREVGTRGLVARLGGDEFTVLLSDTHTPSEALDLAERLLAALSTPVTVQERPLQLSSSIGIAFGSTSSQADLLRNANTAMHHAKSQGKAHYAFFDPAMDQEARARFELELALREVVLSDNIFPHYQPIIDLKSGAVVALEALARWQTAEGSFIPPVQFIPIAEETGLIVPLGKSLLRTACRDLVAWRGEFPHLHLSVNVNVSERQFREPTFVQHIRETLRETGLPASALTLELTESLLLNDTEGCLERLRELDALGIRLTLDDFGTGYSSLSYLSLLPVKALKIDRGFVGKLFHHEPRLAAQNEMIVRSIVGLAKNLGIGITAEGIEEPAQRQHLTSLQVDYGQGYLFSRPMPQRDIAKYLRHYTATPSLRFAA